MNTIHTMCHQNKRLAIVSRPVQCLCISLVPLVADTLLHNSRPVRIKKIIRKLKWLRYEFTEI